MTSTTVVSQTLGRCSVATHAGCTSSVISVMQALLSALSADSMERRRNLEDVVRAATFSYMTVEPMTDTLPALTTTTSTAGEWCSTRICACRRAARRPGSAPYDNRHIVLRHHVADGHIGNEGSCSTTRDLKQAPAGNCGLVFHEQRPTHQRPRRVPRARALAARATHIPRPPPFRRYEVAAATGKYALREPLENGASNSTHSAPYALSPLPVHSAPRLKEKSEHMVDIKPGRGRYISDGADGPGKAIFFWLPPSPLLFCRCVGRRYEEPSFLPVAARQCS